MTWNPSEAVMFVFTCLVLSIVFMGVFLFLGWWLTRKKKITLSPYTKRPLWRANGLPYPTMKRVALFLHDFHQYDNRIFSFRWAALCRETGRLFQDCVNWRGRILLDWTFIQNRHPGNYVSWGSLSDDLQDTISGRHESMRAFQTYRSSPEPSPRNIDPKFAYTRPGPLYVDIDTGILVGWQQVPDTELEVLIVQKPIR